MESIVMDSGEMQCFKNSWSIESGEEERDTVYTFSIGFKDIAGNKGVSKDQTVVTNTIKIDTFDSNLVGGQSLRRHEQTCE